MLNKEVRQKIHNQTGTVNKNSQTADKIQYYSRIKYKGTGGLLLIPEFWVCLHFICALQWGCSVITANIVILMNTVIPNRPNMSVVHKGLPAPLPRLLCYAVFDILGREDSYKTSLFRIQECEIVSSYMGKLVTLKALLQLMNMHREEEKKKKDRKEADLASVLFAVNKKIFTILF